MLNIIKEMYHAWLDYPLREGAVLQNRYRVVQHIGQGSFGIAYLISDFQQPGILKLLKQQRPSKGKRAASLLHAEAETMKHLNHPRIPRIQDRFLVGNYLCLVMDYVKGSTFECMLFEWQSEFPHAEVLRYAAQLLKILEVVHVSGYVHLDVRLPNVILHDGAVFLIDFGLARRIGDHPDESPYIPGKLAYRHLAEPQSDLYAVGHFMLYLLYSNHPLGSVSGINESQPERSWEEELDISDELRHVLRRLLKIEYPYSSAAEAMAELNKIKSQPK